MKRIRDLHRQFLSLKRVTVRTFDPGEISGSYRMDKRLVFIEKRLEIVVGISGLQLAQLLELVDKGEINLVTSRDVLNKIWLTDMSAGAAVDALGLRQNNDAGEIEKLVRDIVAANPGPAADYRNGNEKVLSFFVGQLMKATKGKTNPKIAGDLIRKVLSE